MLAPHLVAGREVGDRPRQAQRPVAAARAELAPPVRVGERALDVVGHAHVAAQQPRVHVAVARHPGPVEARQLALARRPDPSALGLRGRRRRLREALGVGALDVDEEVDAVEQRAAQPPGVAGEIRLAAAAAARGRVAARARVGGGDEQEARREDRRALAAHDRHAAVLQRLAQRLERRPRELGQLVEEEHAVMGEARLPRQRAARRRPPARTPRSCDAARGTGARPTSPRAAMLPGDAVDARHLDRLGPRQRRQDRGQAPREHRLAHAGRAREQQVVGAGRRDGQRLDDVGVAADVGEVEVAAGRRERRPRRDRAAAGARRRAGSRPPGPGWRRRRRRAPRRGPPPAPAGAGPRAPPGPRRAVPSATARAPRQGRISPPRPSSPKTA